MDDLPGPWYHGSPEALTRLRAGSMVTPFAAVAKAFSHKPSVLTFGDGVDTVRHDGRVPGRLYVVAEPVGPGDLRERPRTGRTHWQIRRDLRVELVAEVPVSDPPQLLGDDLRRARQRQERLGDGAFFDAGG